MSDKKQKEAMVKRVKQVIVVGACILFVALMILSGMGSGWLTMFTTVKPGDSVVVDYTLNDIYGNPVLRRRAKEVTVFDKDLEALSRRMLEIMYEEEGVGLAEHLWQNATLELRNADLAGAGGGTLPLLLVKTERIDAAASLAPHTAPEGSCGG